MTNDNVSNDRNQDVPSELEEVLLGHAFDSTEFRLPDGRVVLFVGRRRLLLPERQRDDGKLRFAYLQGRPLYVDRLGFVRHVSDAGNDEDYGPLRGFLSSLHRVSTPLVDPAIIVQFASGDPTREETEAYVERYGYIKFNYTHKLIRPYRFDNFKDRKLCTLISANKMETLRLSPSFS